jgi:CheY-like chemotaxis protein
LDLLEAKSGTLANASGAGALQVGIGPARTVLCIDDNAANLTLVERVVARRPGVELITAMRGHQGLEIARERQPAVILLDINLPDISGEEILVRLRADPRTISIPVIVVSGDATQANITALLAAGATGYLTKPYDINHLLALIDDPRLEAPDNGIPTH